MCVMQGLCNDNQSMGPLVSTTLYSPPASFLFGVSKVRIRGSSHTGMGCSINLLEKPHICQSNTRQVPVERQLLDPNG